MPRASSEARNSAARATSLSDSRTLRHCCSRNSRSASGVFHRRDWRSVTIAPGTMETGELAHVQGLYAGLTFASGGAPVVTANSIGRPTIRVRRR